MKKIFLLIGLIFIVKISFSQSNQPFYVMPNISTSLKQNLAAGSLVLTKDSCNSYLLSSMAATGSSILATPKIYAFPNSQSGNFYMVNRKLNGSSAHSLGMIFIDGTRLWQMGIRAGADTSMSMAYTPTVGTSNVFNVYKDSVVAKHRSSVNPNYSNKLKITADSLWLTMSTNHATRWDNLGNLAHYKNLSVYGNLHLPNLFTLGSSSDSVFVKNTATGAFQLRPQYSSSSDTGVYHTTGFEKIYANTDYYNGQNFQDTVRNFGYTRQTKSYNVITVDDTLNNQDVNITPTSNDVTVNSLTIRNIRTTINKNSNYKFYNGIRQNGSFIYNYNDSVGFLYAAFNQAFNNQGYANGLVSNFGNTISQPSGVRAKTGSMYGQNGGVFVQPLNVAGSLAVVGEAFGIFTGINVGNYYTTTIDTLKGITVNSVINARAGGSCSINTYKGIYVDLLSTQTAGTRNVNNMYAVYLLNRSGVTGSSNNYGIYENFGKNYFTNDIKTGGKIEIASTKAFYFGDETTDGSWRITQSGNNLVFERRESGSWITKSTMNP